MKRPSNIQKFKPVDPKLGIKSSLPKSKSTIALVILLWLSNDKKYEIEYSETDGDKITISENCYDKLIQYLRNNIDIKGDSEEDIMNYVNENQLFHSQLESLIVALELVWRIASIKFKDSNKADSAERTGKKRFEKILSYTNNIDLFDTLIESNKKYCQVLYEWLQGKKNAEDTHLEKQLVRVINYLSDDVVLKMLDNNQNVYFNMTSVYEAMTQKTDEIDINGDGEAKGALRIVKGALGEGLNYYLAYNKNIVTMSDNVDYDEFVYYEQRVRERQKISNVNILLHAAENDDENTTDISCSKNRIIFGAPGTGKSHKLEENSKYFADNMERVTFHPNYSYANFVGAYKPIMSKSDVYDNLDTEKRRVLAVLQDKSMSAQEKYDELYDKFKDEGLTRLPLLLGIYTDENFKTRKVDGSDAASDNSVERNHGRAIRPYLSLNPQNKNKEISYEFVPGPFMRIYVQAMNHPEEDYLLLIEEINRANVAAVFGDVFQLLDRKNGVSEYPIATSEDIKTYLLENLDCLKWKNIDDLTEEEREKYFEMRIPANMYIWATMNSADQGVFPMDTAFKRRWEFEYLSVNDDEQVAAIKDYVIPMCFKDNKANYYISWDSLRTRINNILTSEKCKVNEDKLLGPFFISKNMLDEIKNNKEQIDELEAKDEASLTERDNEALKDMHQKENSYIKAFESKVIMYLFEDVMKMRPENIFIGHHKKNGKMIFSEICKAFEQDGEGIFGIENLENI